MRTDDLGDRMRAFESPRDYRDHPMEFVEVLPANREGEPEVEIGCPTTGTVRFGIPSSSLVDDDGRFSLTGPWMTRCC